ncbi:hypothetical protein ACP4OV_011921 [Aristida adscensionis]
MQGWSSSTAMDDDDSNPPLMATYKHLLDSHPRRLDAGDDGDGCDLPVIDLAGLRHGEEGSAAAARCRAAIVRAASEWGFFQVTGHAVPQALLNELHGAQVAVFRRPFERKVREPLLGFSPESYRWGTPTATSLEQLSWSEAYHIPITPAGGGGGDRTRLVIEEVSTAMSALAQRLARVLVGALHAGDEEDEEEDDVMARCTRSTCFLRLNRYPRCPAASGGAACFGLCPHTDSDFLTVLHQDAVGGLQLLNAGRWLAVRPRPGALIVNVGDLLQAWSNDLYRSVEHRVVASAGRERFSVAFFLCPSYDTVIRPRRRAAVAGAGAGGPRYRSFTFGEYRSQIKDDVKLMGRKLGLERFRLL